MGYPDFPNDAYFYQPTVDGEAMAICKISLSADIDIEAIVVKCQKVGVHTTEELTLELHRDEDTDTPIFTSDTYTYDDFSIGASHWSSFLKFDFAREPLSADIDYWLKVRVDNYVYTDDVRYICFQFDAPEPINTADNLEHPGAQAGIYGYKEI